MKYISRITALLLVLMMLTPTFASALTLSTATQGDLEELYSVARSNLQFCFEPGLLGDVTELTAFDDLENPDAYAYQWYDAADYPVEPSNEDEPTKLCVVNTLEEQIYYCIAADEAGYRLMSPTFVIPAADVNNADLYLNWLYDDYDSFYDAVGGFDTLSAYWYMTETWNLPLTGGHSLAEQILELWWSEREENSFFKPYLLCSCVISGEVESSALILHPNSEFHVDSCAWKMPEIQVNAKVSTPESLLKQESVTLMVEAWDNVETYGWQYYVNDATAEYRWHILKYTDDNLYTLPITKESIQNAYRVLILTTDYGLYESKPVYLGGYDFFNWILTNEDVQAWMADDSVTLADVVARYNADADEEDRTNAEDYTYGEEGESVNLQVPQGTFAEDYVMEIAQVAAERVAQLQNAVMDQLDATGTHVAQVLMALDISFASLANRANKLQPNAPVTLTFEIDTTGLDEALKYLYVYHIANDGTPEVVTGPIGATFSVQPITVDANAFSEYLVMATSDECVYCQNMGMCFYDMLADMTHDEQYDYLQKLNGSYASYMQDYARHVAAGAPAILCTCVNYANGERPNEPMDGTHGTTCPWSDNAVQWIGALGSPVTLKLETGAYKAYEWYLGNTNGTPIGYESTYSTTYTKDAKLYVLKTQDDNNAWSEHWFRVQADMTIMYEYLSYVGDNAFWMESGDRDRQAIYDIMTTTWNVAIDDNADNILAKAILVYWKYNMYAGEEDIFCTCCIGEDDIVSDQIMLHPDAVHTDADCPWRQCKPGLNPALRDDGTLYYQLMLTDANGNLVTVAVSTMLDGKYHYFQDVNTGWYVAYMHIDEETGEQWIIPLPSEKDLNN